MLFLLIVVLMISAYTQQPSGADVRVPAWWQVVPWAAAAVVVVWGLSVLLARRAVRQVQRGLVPFQPRFLAHHQLLWGLRGLMLGLYLWLVFGAGWAEFVYRGLRLADWSVIGNWVVILPFVAMAVAHWSALYRVDLLLRHRQAATAALDPAGAQPGGTSLSGVPLEPFRPWRRRRYLGFHVRHQVLIVLVPVSLWWVGLDGLNALLPKLHLDHAWVEYPLALALVLGVYLISPVFMRLIWNTRRLPAGHPLDGALRARLDALCRRTGLRYRDILIWRTGCDIVNAAVAGLVGPLRYVFLSDGLLRHLTPSEIEAVFAHEIGHVRQRHIPLYLTFALGSMVFVLAIGKAAAALATALGVPEDLSQAVPEGWPFLVAALGLYWGVLFGYLSRRFERQADVFAIRAVGRSFPAADGGPAPLDPLAMGEFARALEGVAALNGMTRNVPAWSHFSIDRRIRFLEDALVDPRVDWRFQRSVRRLKWGWLAATLLGLAFLFFVSG